MKFSFIVCCYNGSNYIKKCIDSLLKQTYENYEIIFINDGSTDDSLKIINKYKNNKIKVFDQKNKGLSYSRNFGVKKCTGDYFIFVDIDDYVREDMLEILNKHLSTNIDLIKFNYIKTYDDHNVIEETNYSNIILDGNTSIDILIENKAVFEMAAIYCYFKKYWTNNKYEFSENRYHEDFGLIPYIILNAKKVLLLNAPLYYYYQSNDSITRTSDVEKNRKKADDVLYFFNLYKDKVTSKQFLSFMANAVYCKFNDMDENYKKVFAKKMIKSDVVNYIRSNNLVQILKKIIYKIKLNKYIKD